MHYPDVGQPIQVESLVVVGAITVDERHEEQILLRKNQIVADLGVDVI